jgi:hypothetical protein
VAGGPLRDRPARDRRRARRRQAAEVQVPRAVRVHRQLCQLLQAANRGGDETFFLRSLSLNQTKINPNNVPYSFVSVPTISAPPPYAEAFFREAFGVDAHLAPYHEDGSCVMSFGVAPPVPDLAFGQACYASCDKAATCAAAGAGVGGGGGVVEDAPPCHRLGEQ